MRHAWINRVGMLSLVGVMVLAGDSYASNSNPVGARVLDATYKVVGPGLGTDSGVSNPNVALNISGTSIVLQVTRDSFRYHALLIFHRGELQRASVHRNRVNTGFNGGAREGTARATRSGGVADEHGEA